MTPAPDGYMTRERRLAEEYEAQLGREARERQERLRKDHFPCCGEHKQDGHHRGCSKRPDEPDVPAVIPGQETLA